MKTLKNILGVAAIAVAFSSCLKDKKITDQEYGMTNYDTQKIVELPAPPTNLMSLALDFVDNVVTVDLVTTGLAADLPATEDVTLTLTLTNSNAMIADYNAANSASVVPFPANFYALQGSGLTVTIPKGSRRAAVKATTNAINFDPAATYGLGFTISAVDKQGYTISTNFGKVLVLIGAKNKYDGVYDVSGTFLEYSNPAFTYYGDYTVDLVTVSSTSCRVDNHLLGFPGYVFLNGASPTYYGNFGLVVHFNSTTNKVVRVDNYFGTPPTYVSSNGRSAELDPSGANQYSFDPANQGIENIKYWMNQPAVVTPHRAAFSEKWEYVGPR